MNSTNKALETWNFDLAAKFYQHHFNNNHFKFEYIEFLYKTADFKTLQALLSSFETKPSWFQEDFISFETLKENTTKLLSLKNANLNDFIQNNISFKKELLISFLMQEKIKSNSLEISFLNEHLKDLIYCEDKLIKASAFSTLIDYLYVLKSEFFLPLNVYEPLQYHLLQSLQKDFDEQGARIYYDKFIDAMRFNLNQKITNKEDFFSKRVAVLFFGALRGDWQASLKNIIEDIALPLNAHCFLFTWQEYYEWTGLSGGISWTYRLLKRHLAELAPEQIRFNNLFKEHFPRTYNVLSKEFSKPLKEEDLAKFMKENTNLKAFHTQDRKALPKLNWGENIYYGQAQVFKLMQEYELKIKKEYDFVIFMRPDVNVLSNISFKELISLKPNEIAEEQMIWGTGTAYPYGRKEAMKLYSSIWHNKELLEKYLSDYAENHSTQLRYSAFVGLLTRKPLLKVELYNGYASKDIACLNALKIPDIKNELEEDIKELRQKGFDEQSLDSFKNFFETLFKEYGVLSIQQRFNFSESRAISAWDKAKKHLANFLQKLSKR